MKTPLHTKYPTSIIIDPPHCLTTTTKDQPQDIFIFVDSLYQHTSLAITIDTCHPNITTLTNYSYQT